MKVNINEEVQVSLTLFGREVLNKYYAKCNESPSPGERYGVFRICRLFEIFGSCVHSSMQETPFEGNVIEFLPHPEPEQRKGDRLTLRELQQSLPWTIRYAKSFRESAVQHKDFQHALIHVMKAMGKVAGMVNDAEHGGTDWDGVERYVADLVVCALRMANTLPDNTIDLQGAVINRIETKNEVKL